MEILRILDAIGRIEKAVGDFYLWLSEVFDDDPEAAGFFYRLSMQERSHANLVGYARKLVHQSPRDFKKVDVDLSAADEVINMIETFRAELPEPALNDALALAIAIESHHAENLHRSIVIESNPKVSALINSLAAADHEHFEMLRDFEASRA